MKIRVNPDEEIVSIIRRGLKENGGYCPCAIVQTEDTKCMCKEFREMESGICKCGLYIKE